MPVTNVGQAIKPVSDVAPYGGVKNPGQSGGGLGGFPAMYTARLYAKLRDGGVIDLTTPLPESYQFELATEFRNPLDQPLSNLASQFGGSLGTAVGGVSTAVQQASGKSTINKWLSGSVWEGASLFTVQVPFVIQAYEDTKSEVVDVMRQMLQLVAPSESNTGFLTAPGPTMAQAVNSEWKGDDITIQIGSFFIMRPCVVENVTCEFDTQMDVVHGAPLSATINVTAKSFWATTKQDLDKYFKKGQ